MGRAYISGSNFLAQRKWVRNRARKSDVITCMKYNQRGLSKGWVELEGLTAQQKNRTEKTANTMGSRSHPSPCRTARKMTSTGKVTRRRVIITNRELVPSPSREEPVLDEGNNAAACSAVDNRETKIEPTLPGRPKHHQWVKQISNEVRGGDEPLITIANNGNPSYRLANKSNTIPVALLITIAPNSGLHPCFRRSFTNGFLRVQTAQVIEDSITRIARKKGMGVLTKLMRAAETTPTRQRVTRSPRQDAMGGAMLSGNMDGLKWVLCEIG